MKPPDPFRIQPYTFKQLANLYSCPQRSFRKWLKNLEKAIGRREGYFYTQRQVRLIVEQLGTP